jgi:Fe-S cluster assembly iron-binding protein IscA
MISLTETSTARLAQLCMLSNASAIAISCDGESFRFRLRDALEDDFVVSLSPDHKLLVDLVSIAFMKGALLDFIINQPKRVWVLESISATLYKGESYE